jgi:diguanylate cyclase (GGDEF)-like protein/PAS domain S-box-containing protein
VSVTIALLLTLLITPLRQQFKFLLFFLAVFFGATGGVGPGVFATLLSVAMVDYFLIQPLHSFAISDPGDLVPLLIFCGVGLVTTWITHRLQRSEETNWAAAAIVESSADSIMRQSLDNTILSWNKAAEHIYGYTAEEAIGRPVSLIVPPDHREELQRLVERVHLGGSIQSYETVRIRKDGAHIDVALTLSPVQNRKGRIVGVSSIAREITERKLAAAAIRQSHEQLERQTHHLRLLAEIGDMLQASSIPSDACAVAARFAQTLFPASSGALFVYSASRNHLEVVIRWGEPQQNEPDFLAPDECWALRTGRLHLVEDSHTGLLCRHLPEPPPTCYLCAPMIAHGETLGMLHLQMSRHNRASSEPAPPESLEISWLARTVAERLALALADMNLRETLRAQSICDPLTGWYNRRYMEETLEREIRRAARNKRPLAVIMLDVDNFKEFNDSFGHEAGDVALQNLCQMLRTHVRSEDVACRYGGDEFVLVLPDTSAELAAQRAEEMRSAVGHVEVQYHGQLLRPMTLSFGIATFPADGRTSNHLLRASDIALFRAKTEGRDRVRSHEQASEPTSGN